MYIMFVRLSAFVDVLMIENISRAVVVIDIYVLLRGCCSVLSIITYLAELQVCECYS